MQIVDFARSFVSKYVVLNEDELHKFIEALEVRRFARKEIILRAGEVEPYVNFIASGLARKFFQKKNDEMITHIARENELICVYESFVSGTPSIYTIEAIEDITLISIPRQKLEDLYLAVPKTERLGRLVLSTQFIQNERWEFDRVRLSAQERLANFIKQNPSLLKRVPQKYLASYLNIKPETFSRLKRVLQNETPSLLKK